MRKNSLPVECGSRNPSKRMDASLETWPCSCSVMEGRKADASAKSFSKCEKSKKMNGKAVKNRPNSDESLSPRVIHLLTSSQVRCLLSFLLRLEYGPRITEDANDAVSVSGIEIQSFAFFNPLDGVPICIPSYKERRQASCSSLIMEEKSPFIFLWEFISNPF